MRLAYDSQLVLARSLYLSSTRSDFWQQRFSSNLWFRPEATMADSPSEVAKKKNDKVAISGAEIVLLIEVDRK